MTRHQWHAGDPIDQLPKGVVHATIRYGSGKPGTPQILFDGIVSDGYVFAPDECLLTLEFADSVEWDDDIAPPMPWWDGAVIVRSGNSEGEWKYWFATDLREHMYSWEDAELHSHDLEIGYGPCIPIIGRDHRPVLAKRDVSKLIAALLVCEHGELGNEELGALAARVWQGFAAAIADVFAIIDVEGVGDDE